MTCRETTGQPIGEINFPIRSNLFKKAICHSCYIHQQTKKLILRHIILDSWVVLTCICHNDCTYMTIVYLPVTELIGCVIKYFKLNIDHCLVTGLFCNCLQPSVKASNSLYHKITCHKYTVGGIQVSVALNRTVVDSN